MNIQVLAELRKTFANFDSITDEELDEACKLVNRLSKINLEEGLFLLHEALDDCNSPEKRAVAYEGVTRIFGVESDEYQSVKQAFRSSSSVTLKILSMIGP